MPFIEHVSDADLERLTLERVVPALQDFGFCYVDGVLGEVAGGAVLQQVIDAPGRGAAGRPAGRLCSRGAPEQYPRDKIAWVSGVDCGCEAINFLLNTIDKMISSSDLFWALSQGFRNQHTLQEGRNCTMMMMMMMMKMMAMVACYPGNGAGYVKHVDNPNSDGRCITCIYYLNKDWSAKEHGGVLRIFPEGTSFVADIEPLFDRLLFFWSDRRNPHEVQPSFNTRYAITVWYFDSEERAEAKRRFKNLTDPSLKQSS
ncbi:hypothetical protein F7725_008642 [Dissostichus mawsoni]|uniref:hypoxia-inducible factor-proline dioxygenase n=1 Tax=Dissostichus mawsoni TaxID=36200 RepID=A0A7J5Y9P6_DISMA|nr:hypothetical protein F7725_008642 [Dissostichus mawsoni]